jgi:hypothetical protein
MFVSGEYETGQKKSSQNVLHHKKEEDDWGGGAVRISSTTPFIIFHANAPEDNFFLSILSIQQIILTV